MQFHCHSAIYGIVNDQIDTGTPGQSRKDRTDRCLMNADIECRSLYRPSGQHQPCNQESHLTPQPGHLRNKLHE